MGDKTKETKMSGLHLKIGTINYPPYIFHNEEMGIVYGIEPSLLEILSKKLNFTYEYAFAPPNEMWGAVTDFGNNNISITGLLGMLHRKEVDVVLGDLYVKYEESKYIDFSQPYGMSHECFLVPVTLPHPRWTALFDPFQWPVWIALILSFAFVVLTLRLAAKLRNASISYNDIYLCILFVLGHVLGIHQNDRGIRSSANRILFIIWLLCVLVIATGYRTELISFMTSPYIPPPVDTVQQLIQSSISKITFGNLMKETMMRSNSQFLKELGQQIIVTYNFTYMFSLMDSGTWAVQSSKETLKYMAAIKFKEGTAGDYRLHLMLECVLPTLSAFGLQQNSLLKDDFNYETQRLIEAGLIQHHRSEFARRLPENPIANVNNVIEPLSLDQLKVVFYLLLFGYLVSFICFVIERIIYRLKSN